MPTSRCRTAEQLLAIRNTFASSGEREVGESVGDTFAEENSAGMNGEDSGEEGRSDGRDDEDGDGGATGANEGG